MGLFGKTPVLDDQLARYLITPSRDVARAVARAQSSILHLLIRSESVVLVAADELDFRHVVVVTDRRVLVMRVGDPRPVRVAAAAEIEVASTPEPSAVCLDGLNLGFWVRFGDRGTAVRFAAAVNKLILTHRPRAVPVLYPDYFIALLSDCHVPATAGNVESLIDRTAFMIGGQAAAYCAQLRDPRAFEAFVARFANGAGPDPRLHLVDDMVEASSYPVTTSPHGTRVLLTRQQPGAWSTAETDGERFGCEATPGPNRRANQRVRPTAGSRPSDRPARPISDELKSTYRRVIDDLDE
jgi:hypothetical protein